MSLESIHREFGSIQVVSSLTQLFNTKILAPVNCLFFPRELKQADFDGLAQTLSAICSGRGGYHIFHQDRLKGVSHLIRDEKQRLALDIIITDMDEILNLNTGAAPFMMLKVPSQDDKLDGPYHDDGCDTNIYTENTLCCYNDPTTEFIRNSDAEISPESAFLYKAKEGAQVFSLQAGSFYRYTGRYFMMPPSFIHRMPYHDKPRLLLSVLKGMRPILS